MYGLPRWFSSFLKGWLGGLSVFTFVPLEDCICVCVHVKYFNKKTVFLQSGSSAGLPTDLSYITGGAAAWGRELPWQMLPDFLI